MFIIQSYNHRDRNLILIRWRMKPWRHQTHEFIKCIKPLLHKTMESKKIHGGLTFSTQKEIECGSFFLVAFRCEALNYIFNLKNRGVPLLWFICLESPLVPSSYRLGWVVLEERSQSQQDMNLTAPVFKTELSVTNTILKNCLNSPVCITDPFTIILSYRMTGYVDFHVLI